MEPEHAETATGQQRSLGIDPHDQVRPRTAVTEPSMESAVARTLFEDRPRPSRSVPTETLSHQMEAILGTARQEAESRVLEAQIQAEEILADATVAGQRTTLEAFARASQIVDEARADLAYARALRESSQRESDQIIERAERAVLDRWMAADQHIRAFAEMTLGDSLARMKAISAELSGAQDLLNRIMHDVTGLVDPLQDRAVGRANEAMPE
jgi:hypothetical protein